MTIAEELKLIAAQYDAETLGKFEDAPEELPDVFGSDDIAREFAEVHGDR